MPHSLRRPLLRFAEKIDLADLARGAIDAIEAGAGPLRVDEEQRRIGLLLALLHRLVGGDAPGSRRIHNRADCPARDSEGGVAQDEGGGIGRLAAVGAWLAQHDAPTPRKPMGLVGH